MKPGATGMLHEILYTSTQYGRKLRAPRAGWPMPILHFYMFMYRGGGAGAIAHSVFWKERKKEKGHDDGFAVHVPE